jgi:uncharacterized membrane protein YozB (DUF420 family)
VGTGELIGAVSAAASALALVVIAVSLVLQWRQNRTAAEDAVRQQHLDILLFTLSNPEFAGCWGEQELEGRDYKNSVYCNIILSHLYMAWLIGSMDEAALTAGLRKIFSGEIGFAYWQRVGGGWVQHERRRARQFGKIANAVFAAEAQARLGDTYPNDVPDPEKLRPDGDVVPER